jgi:hypothetical protein
MPPRPLLFLFVLGTFGLCARWAVGAPAPVRADSTQPARSSTDPGLLEVSPVALSGTAASAAPDPDDARTLPDSADAVPPVSDADPGVASSIASTVDPASSAPSVASSRDGLLPVPGDAGDPSPVATATDSHLPPAPPTATSPPVSTLPGSTDTGAPSTSMTLNLIHLMVKRGLLTKDDADGLIKQAQQETVAAQAQQSTSAALPEANAPDDTVGVTYVPDVVKNQIRQEVTADVMKQQREDELAKENPIPSTAPRFRVSGDLRLRYEGDMYPSGNAQGDFPNYNAINTGSGFDVNSAAPALPEYNVSQDRNRFRLRARFGTDVDLHDGFSVGLRIGTGQDDSPTTENQTLDVANNGQGGNFSKYAIWLDRAFLRYELGGTPDRDLTFTGGRFENPFFHTSMIFADDLGFDGLAIQGRYKVAPGLTPFATFGAFPVFNTDLNFSSDQTEKFSSEDKYLIAAQVGTVWTINKDFSAKGAAAYYYYENIAGKVSDPMLASSNEAGNTDDSRPSFAQNGNTYIALRNYVDPNPGTTPEIEYYGLATPFHVLALTGQLDYSHFDPFHISIQGEFIDNVAFNRNAIINNGPAFDPGPQNNTTGANASSFAGGNLGAIVRVNFGKVALEKFGDWNVGFSYRYVESDSTIDGFTDADFGGDLVGTNLQGYTIGGNLGLSPHVWTGLRFMSADAIAGPTFHNDLVQFDLNAQF